jgi:hypothetical protein
MAPWVRLDSQKAIDAFMEGFNGFHDACLREIATASGTYVERNGAMTCPGHLDTSLVLWFQSQGAKHRAVEIHCNGVSLLRLSPTPDGCDSILSGGEVTGEAGAWRLVLSFIGGPLVSAPNSVMEIVPNDLHGAPDIEIKAESMSWRPLSQADGSLLRYQATQIEGA